MLKRFARISKLLQALLMSVLHNYFVSPTKFSDLYLAKSSDTFCGYNFE